MFLLVIFIIIFILLISLMIYKDMEDKLLESNIRLDEAEKRIDNNLKEKYEYLNKGVNLIKNEIKLDKDAFNELLKLRIKKNNNFNLDKDLNNIYEQFVMVYNANDVLTENIDIFNTKRKLDLINEELLVLKEYYERNLINYNNLINGFPTKIIARIKKYQKRLSFDEDNNNNFDI